MFPGFIFLRVADIVIHLWRNTSKSADKSRFILFRSIVSLFLIR